MATCKECLHYEACANMLRAMGYTCDGDGLNADKRCIDFAPKAALDILIAHAVCCSPELICMEHCPFSGKENRCHTWDVQKVADAVKTLRKREPGGT